MPIQILPESVVAQIAAGEVIERPASVVKELLENSLDAGARTIRVETEAGGRRLIRVTDDGCGIPRDEVELAFVRHATSKLYSIEDLYQIRTLGFRGEALASIAAVAQVTLITRTEQDAAAVSVRVEGGSLIDQRLVGAPVGTVISVENLFFNTPARLKFLKSEATERRQIDTLITRYAMAYPSVRFVLAQDGRATFNTAGTGQLSDVLIEALGVDVMREMLEVDINIDSRADLPTISVYGYVSAPHLNRNTRSHITLFVNGRHIYDTSLNYAVGHAYHTLLPDDRYPIAVLMLDIPPDELDVNVHPAKAEVRFRSPDAVFSAVQRAVRQTVIAHAPIPPVDPSRFGQRTETRFEPRSSEWTATPGWTPQQALELGDFDAGQRSHQRDDLTQFSAPTLQPEPPTQRPRTLPPLRVVGQVAACYIVAEGPAGMYLIDQHAAHERILYEQFMREQQSKAAMSQHTLDAITVELEPDAARLVEANLSLLAEVGFEIEPFGGNHFRVRAVPSILAHQPPAEAIVSILSDLEQGTEPGAAELEAQIVLRVCKAAAVKAGQILSYDEMQSLIRQLERCTSPRTCPHGRPTLIHMSADQLAREFGRT